MKIQSFIQFYVIPLLFAIKKSDSQCTQETLLNYKCQYGWTVFAGSCYFVNINELNWDDASQACADFNATLMVIHNDKQMAYAAAIAKSYKAYPWIGASAIVVQDFIWADGTSLSLNSNYWCNGEPNNHNKEGDELYQPCVYVFSPGYGYCFDDFFCNQLKISICQKSRNN